MNEEELALFERIADALEMANHRRVSMLDRADSLLEKLSGSPRPTPPATRSPAQDIGDSMAMVAEAQDAAEIYGAMRFPSGSGRDAVIAKEAFQAGAAWQRGRGA